MNINKIILMGRLTADPELKISQSNIPNTRFTIAVNRKFAKEGTTQADFFNCVAFRTSAEFVAKHFKKGSSIIVFGSVQFEKYTDKDGNGRISTNVLVDEVQFGESKSSSNTAANFSENTNSSSTELNSEFFEEIKNIEGKLPF